MSLRAIDRAFEFAISPPDKLVLLTLANYTSATGLSFPSVFTICSKTRQDRKTVIRALDRLEHAGVIEDTGKRTGQTKQIKIYRLNWAIEEAVPNPALFKESQISRKESQISRKESQTTLENRNEPFITNSGERKRSPTLQEVIEYAKTKGVKPDNATLFWNRWEAVNWKIGGQRITKWKLAFSNWQIKQQEIDAARGNRKPQMPYKTRQDRINKLNERKATLMRMEQTPKVLQELEQIRIQLFDL